MPSLRVIEPHGFCSGVKAAVDAAFSALAAAGGRPVWCLHELVHNAQVVDALRTRGMVFVESPADVPPGGTLLFSAHGVSPAVRAAAAARGLRTIDATCPFVTRVHREVRASSAAGLPVVIIGRADHAEVAGTAGEASHGKVFVVATPAEAGAVPIPDGAEIAVVAQTTLAREETDGVAAALRARFPRMRTSSASEACNATRDRQRAVREFVEAGGEGVIVLGSPSSSNTRRLAETALSAGAKFAVRAGTPAEVDAIELPHLESFGLTSGASTPEEFLLAALETLRAKIERLT